MGSGMIRAEVLKQTADREGYRKNTYTDTRGNPTQGQGFNMKDPVTVSLMPLDVQQGKRQLTHAESDDVFAKRMQLAQSDAANFAGGDTFQQLDPNRQGSLTDMSYNMGSAKLSGFHNVREALQTGDMRRAADEIVNSNYARAKDTGGRAYKNAYTMLTGLPYDPNAIKMYQKTNGLTADGILGPQTYQHMRQKMGD